MRQYPPAQEPDGQPPSPYPQYPYYPPQPQYPYTQPGYTGAPIGAPQQPYAPPPRRSPAPLILGGIAALVVIAVLVLLVARPFGGSSIGGTWYGAGTTGSTGDSAETFRLETYLTLTQSGSSVTGSGELCSLGSSNIPFTVTGTLQGSALAMTWTLAASSPGAEQGNTERVTGQFKNDALALTSTDASGYYTSTLKHGGHDAFTSACKSVV